MKFAKQSAQLNSAERELHQLRNLKMSYGTLHRQYLDLQESVRASVTEAQAYDFFTLVWNYIKWHGSNFNKLGEYSEVNRLEQELRRVERSAAAGAELRERARLAAASHARERRLTDAELRHTSLELLSANGKLNLYSPLVNMDRSSDG